eukprot:TRINITY_DN4009_c0_g1_i9.p1 TRINITY_DN4009_c0_g1~~TRINITY_DN4009_c0_g1_i9.p1  ORF type:complete len:301 (+),score=34.43 TRINITY_DN4009_c0_g1_i9:60-905(+)
MCIRDRICTGLKDERLITYGEQRMTWKDFKVQHSSWDFSIESQNKEDSNKGLFYTFWAKAGEELCRHYGIKYIATEECENFQFAFVCDCTGSMDSYIQAAKDTVKGLMNKITKSYGGYTFFSFIGYRDHEGEEDWGKGNVVKFSNFDTSDKTVEFINSISAGGGEDPPEAVVDGLDAAVRLNWRPNMKNYIIHILDAPPHGREFDSPGDTFPDGCPCKISYQQVLTDMRSRSIKYVVIRCTKWVDKIIEIFQEIYGDLIVVDLSNPSELEAKVVEAICKDL